MAKKINKTLLELLQEKRFETCNVKIGSKQGSSFWYCGKGIPALSIPAIKRARVNLLVQCHHNLRNLEYRYNHLDKIYEDTIKQAKKKGVKDFETYQAKMLKKKDSEKVSLPRRIASVQYDITINLLDRPVQEVVFGISPDETPCWIIYVKGNEKGSYWTIKEYEKRHKKELYDYDN